MELDQILTQLVNNTDGALGAALGGMDGLLIEQFSNDAKLILSSVVAEHSNLLRSTRVAYEVSLGAGQVDEILVSSEKLLGLTKCINPDFFVALILEPSGNIGKARLFLAAAARQLKGLL
ncbi:MAG: roadblock/LC7 domain-containing protein [Deinococcales bacterium]